MADKTFRPITDVEIVEQMTENDTVLIEQGGMIKRTKGVIGGGGEKYIIGATIKDSVPVISWLTPVSYEDFLLKITSGEDIRVIQHMYVDELGVVGVAEAIIMTVPNESMSAIECVNFKFATDSFPPITFSPDGTLMITAT